MKRLSFALSAALLSTSPMLSADDAERKPAEREPGQLFAQLDKDGNGTLAKDEVPENQVRFFERLVRVGDKNDDGQLTKAEFAAAMNQAEPRADARPGAEGRPGEGRPQFSPEMFQRLDANSDGKLTRDELPEQARERMGQLFERLGKDAITLEDLQKMQGRPGGPGRPGEGRPGEGRPGEGRPGQGRPGVEMIERFRQMDANKDGKVTLDEVPEEAKGRVREMLERTGRDAIDLEQMARMMAQGGPRGPEGREGDRPRPEGREGDRPRPEGREGDRPRPEGREGDRPSPEGDRPRPETRDGDRPRPEGPEGDRPRPEGNRPPMPRDGERPPMPRDGEDRPRDGFRPGPRFLIVLDENRDGQLSRDELAGIAKKFEELDRNQDGQIDRQELFGFGPGGPGTDRDGEGGPRGFGPRDGEGRPPEGFRPPRDGDRRPPEGDRPEREGGDRPRPDRPESDRDDRA